jgi:PAS domain S-box-containing protein
MLVHECLHPEKLLYSFFNAATYSNLGLFIIDTNLRFLCINQALAEINGFPVEAHVGKPLHDLLPAFATQLVPVFETLFQTGESVSNLEISGYTPGQPETLRHWVGAFFPITDATGAVVAVGGSVREVTEFRYLLEQLREHEFNWQTAQRIAHVGSWQYDCITDTVTWSEETYRIHGYDPNRPPPRREEIRQYLHPDDRERYWQLLEKTQRGESFEMDLRIIRPSGELRYIEARGEPGVFDEQGRLLRIFGTVLDVTERKHAEIALQRNEFALREAQKIAHVGHWHWDGTIRKVFWSDEVFRIHGLEPKRSALNIEDTAPFIHPDDVAIHTEMAMSVAQGESCQADLRIVRPNGEVRHIEARCLPREMNDQGVPMEIFGTVLDISDRKHIEEKLRRSEAELQAVLKALPDMLIRVSKSGERLFLLPGTLIPYKPVEELQNQSVYDTLPLDLAHQRMHHVRRAIDTGECQVYEYDIPINGVIHQEEARIVAINDNEALIIVRDMTERHQIERMKDEFISMVSHELRTPLTSIQVALGLLDDQLVDPTSEDGRNMIHIATAGVDRLVRLVNDILDLQRLESGKLRIQKQPCQTQDLIDAAIQQMQDLANQSAITISTSGSSYLVKVDVDRMVQVLTNLLSNAIRFSPAASTIHLHVEAIPCSEGNPHCLRNAITDQGHGIPPEKLECIFERFQQVDASDSREKSGSGLGLAICQNIIQQHGGQIWAESVLNQGSTFYFTMPFTEGQHNANEARSSD